MAAVMAMQSEHDDWQDEVHARLDRWAEWSRGPSVGGAGGGSGYLRERLDKSRDSYDMSAEVETTEKAVARFRLEARDGWRIIKRFYLGRLGEIEIASELGYTRGFIGELLRESRSRIGEHILKLERLDAARG